MIRTLVCKDLEYSPSATNAAEKAKITKTVKDYTRVLHLSWKLILSNTAP
jgi:hypothetical protein